MVLVLNVGFPTFANGLKLLWFVMVCKTGKHANDVALDFSAVMFLHGPKLDTKCKIRNLRGFPPVEKGGNVLPNGSVWKSRNAAHGQPRT